MPTVREEPPIPPCRYCGCPKDKHDVIMPSADGWKVCYGCGGSHVYMPKECRRES